MSKPETLLVFGDSLSDQGNAFDLSGRVLKVPIPPASAGYNGWFSNGLIQSGVTADLLGAEAENYAVGGARAVGSRTVAQYLEESDFDTPEIMLADPDPVALATDGYLGGQLKRYLLDAAGEPAGRRHGGGDLDRRQRLQRAAAGRLAGAGAGDGRGGGRQHHPRGGGDRGDRGRAGPPLQPAGAGVPAAAAAAGVRRGGRRAQRGARAGGCVPGEPGGRRGDRRHAPHRRRRSPPTRAPSG